MDTATGECSSFDLYRSNPTNFFMRRFAGMTLHVAIFLVKNVFLNDPTDDSQHIGAHEFGIWIRDLPTLLGSSQLSTHTYNILFSLRGVYFLPRARLRSGFPCR
jgi:hypothetical protein